MISVFLYTVEDVSQVELPENIRLHCDRYTIEEKRRVSRFAYAMLTERLEALGYPAMDITFTEKGKAVHPSIFFSISHSKRYIAIAISENPVGVDVEEWIPEERLGIASRVLSDAEMAEFKATPRKSEYLTEKWTVKEAFGKAKGFGLSSNEIKNTVEGYTMHLDGCCLSVYPVDSVRIVGRGDDDFGKFE